MAVQLTPLGRFVVLTVKWIGIPALFWVIGVTLIGPNIKGKTPAPKEHKPRVLPKSEHGKEFQKIREKDN